MPRWPLYKKPNGKKEKEKTVIFQTLLNVTKKGDLGVVSHVAQIVQCRNQSQLHSWAASVISKLS